MKKIKIFLASSIDDLKFDRIEIGNFFRKLNDIYLDNGIHFSLIMCEDYDNTIMKGGKQTAYDAEIRDSELCLFLFFTKVGEYTKHEFEVALENYQVGNKPKIVTYFKYIDDSTDVTSEVSEFMTVLDKEIGHYYNKYNSIDTLKLGILMQIKCMKLDSSNMDIEDGIIKLNGEEVADSKNIPMFNGNLDLVNLKKKYAEITEEYYTLRPKYVENPDDMDVYLKYSKVASERADIDKKTKDMEKQLLGYAERTQETIDKGNLSQRQKEGYRLIEIGDYEGALMVLDKGEIYRDIEHNKKLANTMKENLQTNINEIIQRIEVLSVKGITAESSKEIMEHYETVTELIREFNLNREPFFAYTRFLRDQNVYDKAKDITEELLYYYKTAEDTCDEDLAMVYNNLGLLYDNINRKKDAEKMLISALNVSKRLAEKNPDEYEPYLAMVYNNLGTLYNNINCKEVAEEMLASALEINKKLVEKNPDEYELYLAMSYNNLGFLYDDINRKKDAEEFYTSALEIRKRLAEKNPDAYKADLATTYNNLGALYNDINRKEDAEKMLISALNIHKKLAEKNPNAYEPYLAIGYNNLGALYDDINRKKDAEKNYTSALEIIKRLAKKNPDAYEPDLATSYNNLGGLYDDINRKKDAEKFYILALEIYKRLAEKNPDVY